MQDFRSENLVAEPTGTALQKRHVRRGPRVKKVKASDPNPDRERRVLALRR